MNTKNFLVTSYKDPDLDGVACIVAYTELLNKTGRPAAPGIFGSPHAEANFVIEKFNLAYPPTPGDPQNFNQVIVVDNSYPDILEPSIKPENVIEVIDHRKHNEAEAFPNAKVQIELVGSCATLITEKFKEKNLEMSAASTQLLYSAILSNTLNFQSKTTTQKDQDMAGWLSSKFSMPANLAHDMFVAKSDLSGTKLLETLRGDAASFNLADKKVSMLQLEIINSQELVDTRKEEIIAELKKQETEWNLDIIFLTIIDLESQFNLFVSANPLATRILENIFQIKFLDNVAKRPGLIMRKEIVPQVKEYLEKK